MILSCRRCPMTDAHSSFAVPTAHGTKQANAMLRADFPDIQMLPSRGKSGLRVSGVKGSPSFVVFAIRSHFDFSGVSIADDSRASNWKRRPAERL
jgi:hypothetical protein